MGFEPQAIARPVDRQIVQHADPARQLVAFAIAASVFMIAITCAASAYVVTRASSPFAKACVAVAPGTPVEFFEHSMQHAGATEMVASPADNDERPHALNVATVVRADHDARFYDSHCVGEFDADGVLLRSRLYH